MPKVRIISTFISYSQVTLDSIFTAVLFTSEHSEIVRYTDEGNLTEICKWKVDLSNLPSFMQNANIAGPSTPFYTGVVYPLRSVVRKLIEWCC